MRRVGGVLAAVALVLAPASLAAAGSGVDPVTECGNGVCVEVGTPGEPGGSTGGGEQGGGGTGTPDPCTYEPVDPSSQTVGAIGGQPGGTGGWYWRECGGQSGGVGWRDGALVWLPTAPVVSPEALARQARSRLELPAVAIAVSPRGTALVNLPVWLALSGGWQQRSASASVPGVSVTATARPQQVRFDLGDGRSLVCEGPGTVYRPWVHDPHAPSPDCGTVYRRPSVGVPGEAYRITATVTWSVTWAGASRTGTLEGLTTTGTTTLRVAESQAVIR